MNPPGASPWAGNKPSGQSLLPRLTDSTHMAKTVTTHMKLVIFACKPLTSALKLVTFACKPLTSGVKLVTFVCKPLTSGVKLVTFVCKPLTSALKPQKATAKTERFKVKLVSFTSEFSRVCYRGLIILSLKFAYKVERGISPTPGSPTARRRWGGTVREVSAVYGVKPKEPSLTVGLVPRLLIQRTLEAGH
jgi:hypothetical protein